MYKSDTAAQDTSTEGNGHNNGAENAEDAETVEAEFEEETAGRN